jgi:hypothetical protein
LPRTEAISSLANTGGKFEIVFSIKFQSGSINLETAAIEAAKAVGGIAVFPPFGENRLPSETDWNDYLRDKNE